MSNLKWGYCKAPAQAGTFAGGNLINTDADHYTDNDNFCILVTISFFSCS